MSLSITLRSAALATSMVTVDAGFSGYRRAHSFLSAGMQPDVVAHTLVAVVDEWQSQAEAYNQCQAQITEESKATCKEASDAFVKSCSTVTQAALQGSGGSREDTQEYLADVCQQKVLDDAHREQCTKLAEAVTNGMSQDSLANRESTDASAICSSYWTKFLADETAREDRAAKLKAEEDAKRQAEEEAQAKKEAEKAQVKAEAQAKADEEAKNAAQKKAEAKAEEEAAAKAEEDAKLKAEAEANRTAEEEAKAKGEAAVKTLEAENATQPVHNTSVSSENATQVSNTTAA